MLEKTLEGLVLGGLVIWETENENVVPMVRGLDEKVNIAFKVLDPILEQTTDVRDATAEQDTEPRLTSGGKVT